MEKYEKIEMLRYMLLIRKFEEKAGEMYTQGKIGGFLHLYIGQEAVGVGFITALREDDYVIGSYREHGQALTKGAEPRKVMAELYGKSTGISRGKGGSMHMFDKPKNFLGGTGIVGGSIPIAAGVGFAINYQETDQVVLCFFGDGAVNEGSFHESLNMVSLWNLPVIYICENNLYGMGTAVHRVAAVEEIVNRAKCYDIETEQVDGMDVLACREIAERAIRRARKDKKPRFIEAITYRYRGHSMADPGTYRTKDEIEEWRKRDPIEVYRHHLIEDGIISEEDWQKMNSEIDSIIHDAVDFAEKSPEPTMQMLYEDVYVS